MNGKIRVLHLLGELRPSGAELMFKVAYPYFASHAVEAEIVSIGKELGIFARQLSETGYKIHHVPFRASIGFVLNLYRLMKNGHYDAIHLHSEKINFWLGLIALSTGVGVVLRTVHNCFEFKGNLKIRRMLQRRILAWLGLQHVSISPSVSNNELTTFGLKTRLIPNWYDDRRFGKVTLEQQSAAKLKLGIPQNTRILISVGNCSRIKNHTALIEAISLLPQENRPFYIHVGCEDAEHSERALSEKLGLQSSCRFLGPVAEVEHVLQAADIYAMPSLFEGFGIAAAEALACGLPVLFTDVPGLADFRSEFPNIFYSACDAQSLAKVLQEIMSLSTYELRSIANSYPEICRGKYGIEQGARQYLEIYSSALKNLPTDH